MKRPCEPTQGGEAISYIYLCLNDISLRIASSFLCNDEIASLQFTMTGDYLILNLKPAYSILP